jgi:hypothetical protein
MGEGIRRSIVRTFREARRLLPISVYELDRMLYERAGCITSDWAGFCDEIVFPTTNPLYTSRRAPRGVQRDNGGHARRASGLEGVFYRGGVLEHSCAPARLCRFKHAIA